MTRPGLIAAVLIAFLGPVHFLLPEDISIAVAALTLTAIAGAYIGFAAMADDATALVQELVGATLFGAAALFGLLYAPWVMAVGIIAHAVWDLAHHLPIFKATVPRWYIPMCVWVDVAVGGLLLFRHPPF